MVVGVGGVAVGLEVVGVSVRIVEFERGCRWWGKR